MTYLYIPRTALVCECGEDFVYPSKQACPACGQPVILLADPHGGTITTSAAAMAIPRGATPASAASEAKGTAPDEGARMAVYFGIGLCLALMVVPVVLPSAVHAVLPADMDIPVVFTALRVVLVFAGVWGLFKGLLSAFTWSSGARVYRKFRFKE